MDKNKIIRTSKRRIGVYIKVPVSVSEFMKEKNYSPTAIFMEAVKELGYEE